MTTKTMTIQIRVTEAQRELFQRCAELEARTVSDWARLVLLAAAKEEATELLPTKETEK
jgi:uncharacterized protein (DUF1778 family)